MKDAFVCFMFHSGASQWQEVVSSTSFGVSNSDSVYKIGPKILLFWTNSSEGLDMEFSREQQVFTEVIQIWHVVRLFGCIWWRGRMTDSSVVRVQVESFAQIQIFHWQTKNGTEGQSTRMIRLTWWCSSGKQPHENLKAGTGDFWSWSFHSDSLTIEPPQRSFLLVTSFLHYSHSWMMTCDHSSVCARCLIDRQILLLALGEEHVVRSEESTWEPAPSKTEFYFHTLPSHSGQQRFTRQCLGVFFGGFFFLNMFFFLPFVGGWSNRKTANRHQQENNFQCWKATTETVTEKNEWID